ncbi:DUF982 domain-containing protein [Mesorhizobium sp. M0152]|uniref:DUF982 domain-containing protein n=1 Tax=Mesorhizobium sp. M0152 TaxID=2956898 RepID=UPI0033387949
MRPHEDRRSALDVANAPGLKQSCGLRIEEVEEQGNEIGGKRFSKPVRVLQELGYTAEISSVMQAYALLSDWPPSTRDAAHAIALDTCKTALAAAGSSEAARRMFVAFARERPARARVAAVVAR